MKKKLCLMLLVIVTVSAGLMGQRRVFQVSYDNDPRYRSSYYNDGYSYQVYDRMSRNDRARLDYLYEKLDRRKWEARRDGRLSRRELERIRNVENDIADIYQRYSRNNRNNRSRYRSVCR